MHVLVKSSISVIFCKKENVLQTINLFKKKKNVRSRNLMLLLESYCSFIQDGLHLFIVT